MFIDNLDHMIKMAAMPLYSKNPSKFSFSGTTETISMKLGMKHRGLEQYNELLDDLDIFYSKVNIDCPLNEENC